MFRPINIEHDYYVLKELKLNANEFYVVFLIWELHKGNKEAEKVLLDKMKTYRKANTINNNDLVIPLNEESITNVRNTGLFTIFDSKPDNKGIDTVLNLDRCREVFLNINTAFEELQDIFNNVTIKFTNGGETFVNNINNIKEAKEEYYNAIYGSVVQHVEILKICKQAIKDNKVNIGLSKIIKNRLWNSWRSKTIVPKSNIKSM